MPPEKKLISIAKFMKMANHHYYSNQMPLGISGDFITSPEISQVFGEMIALWCIEKWHHLGQPKEINVIEFGPGRATLMCDILRICAKYSFYKAIKDIYFVEINQQLKEMQAKNIAKYAKNINVTWGNNFEILKTRPSIFIANEFFDCLAINQYIYQNNQWYKAMINLEKKPHFIYVKSNYFKKPTNEGDIIEVSKDSTKLIKKIANYIQKNQGNALVIDYGYIKKNNNISSLQGVKNHQYHDILSNFGKIDLSAHVDFLKLITAIKNIGIKNYQLTTQAEFLKKYGIEIRAAKLLEKANYKEKAQIAIAVDRLISNNKMGELFKVLEF